MCRCDLQWERDGHDHGAALAADRDIRPPFTPLYLHYNSGRHVSSNGRELARLLESLVRAWPVPVEEIAIVAHSMGGLVTRSALHYGIEARRAWPSRVTKIVFLGTPHDGAPLKRGGNWVNVVLDRSPYTTAFARLGKLRSAGITDLRHGSLLDEDWAGKVRFAAASRATSKRRLVPLPQGFQCFAAAASLARRGGCLRERHRMGRLIELNADVGEGGPDALVIPHVQRVSIACGGHVGDADSMRATLLLARQHGVMAGAHPGYPDPVNLGRKAMLAPAADISRWVLEQTRALQAVADELEMKLFHVKPHGALYNRAAADRETAEAVIAALQELEGLALVALAGSPRANWARAAGIEVL